MISKLSPKIPGSIKIREVSSIKAASSTVIHNIAKMVAVELFKDASAPHELKSLG